MKLFQRFFFGLPMFFSNLEIVDHVYEASVIAEKWPQLLMDLSGNFHGNGGVLFAFTPHGTEK